MERAHNQKIMCPDVGQRSSYSFGSSRDLFASIYRMGICFLGLSLIDLGNKNDQAYAKAKSANELPIDHDGNAHIATSFLR